jgi:hypothetical protein
MANEGRKGKLMSEYVRPLEAGRRVRLGRTNGFGWTIMGLTRVDEDGNCFGTRWYTAAGLPILPLDRYYLKEGDTTYSSRGRTSTETTSYQILGTAPLRSSEIIRTYIYCWLIAPLIGAGPLLLYLVNADHLAHSLPGGIITFLILMFVILFAGPILLLVLHTRYRERFAPLRVPAWL